jgi:hypothetical protein
VLLSLDVQEKVTKEKHAEIETPAFFIAIERVRPADPPSISDCHRTDAECRSINQLLKARSPTELKIGHRNLGVKSFLLTRARPKPPSLRISRSLASVSTLKIIDSYLIIAYIECRGDK